MKRLIASTSKSDYIRDFKKFLNDKVKVLPGQISDLSIGIPRQLIRYTDNPILSSYNKDFVDLVINVTKRKDGFKLSLSLYIFPWDSREEFYIDKTEFIDANTNNLSYKECADLINRAIQNIQISENDF